MLAIRNLKKYTLYKALIKKFFFSKGHWNDYSKIKLGTKMQRSGILCCDVESKSCNVLFLNNPCLALCSYAGPWIGKIMHTIRTIALCTVQSVWTGWLQFCNLKLHWSVEPKWTAMHDTAKVNYLYNHAFLYIYCFSGYFELPLTCLVNMGPQKGISWLFLVKGKNHRWKCLRWHLWHNQSKFLLNAYIKLAAIRVFRFFKTNFSFAYIGVFWESKTKGFLQCKCVNKNT